MDRESFRTANDTPTKVNDTEMCFTPPKHPDCLGLYAVDLETLEKALAEVDHGWGIYVENAHGWRFIDASSEEGVREIESVTGLPWDDIIY